MKIRVWGIALVASFIWVVSAAFACPYESQGKTKKTETAGSSATTVAAKAGDARSETGAEITKTKKGGCNKPCGLKKAKTVADKAGAVPCHGKSTTTAASASKGPSKGCGKGCCKKSAKLAAHKHGAGAVRKCPITGKPIAEKDCPLTKKVQAVLASLPTIKYRVDGQVTECSKQAETMAEKTGKPIEFIVGEDSFPHEGEATARLAALLDTELESLQTIQFVAGGKCHRCPMTARSIANRSKTPLTYRVGGVDFQKREDAEKALEAVRKAVAEIKLVYKVDGKTYGCDKMASAKCKESGKKMIYVVGDEETCCEKRARLMLAEAKIRKIIETAAALSSL